MQEIYLNSKENFSEMVYLARMNLTTGKPHGL